MGILLMNFIRLNAICILRKAMLFFLVLANNHCNTSKCPGDATVVRKGNVEECVTPSGVRHGFYLEKNSKGHEIEKGYYIKGKKNGKWESWWDNGEKKVECNFKDGKLHGVYREWHLNGKFYFESEYFNGKKVSHSPSLKEVEHFLVCCDDNGILEICMTKDGVQLDQIIDKKELRAKSQLMCR
jgi:hypothetical protein